MVGNKVGVAHTTMLGVAHTLLGVAHTMLGVAHTMRGSRSTPLPAEQSEQLPANGSF